MNHRRCDVCGANVYSWLSSTVDHIHGILGFLRANERVNKHIKIGMLSLEHKKMFCSVECAESLIKTDTCVSCGRLTWIFKNSGKCVRCAIGASVTAAERVVRAYNYTPSAYIYSMSSRDRTEEESFFGVEIEIESDERKNKSVLAKNVLEIAPPYSIIKHDGSLTNGFEVVTSPFTWRYYLSNRSMFDKIYSHPDVKILSTCGLHVHVSRSFFTKRSMRNAIKLIYNNPYFIYQISGRRNMDWIRRYTRMDMSDEDILFLCDSKVTPSKYYAMNFSHPQTVEFRMFENEKNVSIVHSAIEFAHATIRFSRIGSNLDGFLKFIDKHRDIYGNISKRIKDRTEIRIQDPFAGKKIRSVVPPGARPQQHEYIPLPSSEDSLGYIPVPCAPDSHSTSRDALIDFEQYVARVRSMPTERELEPTVRLNTIDGGIS